MEPDSATVFDDSQRLVLVVRFTLVWLCLVAGSAFLVCWRACCRLWKHPGL
jgi:hypothetical protein